MQLRWLFVALCTSGVLAALHFWALSDFMYWRYRWFDTVMHFLGGVSIGAFAVALLRTYRPICFLGIVVGAFVSWEVFEAIEGIAVLPGINYTWDTAHDLLNDTFGAVLMYGIARYTVWRSV